MTVSGIVRGLGQTIGIGGAGSVEKQLMTTPDSGHGGSTAVHASAHSDAELEAAWWRVLDDAVAVANWEKARRERLETALRAAVDSGNIEQVRDVL